MIETVDDGLLMDTPFLRRVREKGRAEGRVEGRTEGRVKGRIEALQKATLDVLATRLKLTVSEYRRIEAHVEAFTDENRLRSLLQTAILAGDVAEFEAALAG
jgi:predicted transposase YdaD